MRCLRLPAPGTALSEYVLIAALVFSLSLVGILGVGNNMKGWLLALKDSVLNQSATTKAETDRIALAKGAFVPTVSNGVLSTPNTTPSPVVTPPPQAGGSTTPTPPATTSPSTPIGLQIPIQIQSGRCTSSQACVQAGVLTGKTVVLGASGQTVQATTASAAALQQLADIFKKDPTIDTKLVDMLTQMANQGHDMADSQAWLFADRGGYDDMKSSMQEIDQTLSLFKSMSTQLKPYLAEMAPQTRDLVQNASKVIISIASSYDMNYSSGVSWSASFNNVSLTHTNSNTICTSGGKTTVCVQ